MKKILLTICIVLVTLIAASAKDQWTLNGVSYDVDTIIFPHPVGPGVTFGKYDLPAMPLKVSVMTMDLTNPYITMETCMGGDKTIGGETPTSMVARNTRPGHEVVGATNGDFFATTPPNQVGMPTSGQLTRGKVVESPTGRASFVLDNNKRPYIDFFDFSATATCGETVIPIAKVNKLQLGGDATMLYTNDFGPRTFNQGGGKMALISPKSDSFKWLANSTEQGVVDSVFEGAGLCAIPEGKAILWMQGNHADYAEALHPGDEISINLKAWLRSQKDYDPGFKEMVGGSNHIIMRNFIEENTWNDRHPRTCIGFNADSTKVYFVVVDGRSIESTGITLKEAVGIFKALGAANAVNLDGGGSSCMVVNDEIVNTPSDGSTRAVGNGCLLISTAPADDSIGMLNFEPRCYNVSTSARLHPAIWGYNQYGVLKTRNVEGCTRTCDPQVGHFDSEGYFIASSTPASGNLYAEYHGVTTTQPIQIMNAHKTLRDDSVTLDSNHRYEIQLLGISGMGQDLLDPGIMSWTSSDPSIATVGDDGIVTAHSNGRTLISGIGEQFNDTLTVRVENPTASLTTIENQPIDPETWTISQSGGKNRVVTTLDHGMSIHFTGASSRNPYIKLAKRIQLWGIPDTLRVRFNAHDLTVKRVNLSTQTTRERQIISEIEVPSLADGSYTVNLPTAQWCDASDLSNYPLGFIYLYFKLADVKSGQPYTLDIPGIELVYQFKQSGVKEVTADKNGLSIYPNPAYAGTMVSVTGNQGTRGTLYSLEGRKVKRVTLDNGQFSTSGLAPGIYLLEIDGHQAARLLVK